MTQRKITRSNRLHRAAASVLSSLYHPQHDGDKKGTSRGATPDVTPSVRPVDAMADVRGGTSGGSPYPDNAGVNPPSASLLEVTEAGYPANNEARRLLHVAMTRAAHQLWVMYTGTPSPLLPDNLRGLP